MEPYRSYFPHTGLLLSNTEELSQRVMSLPTGTGVTPQDITTVCHLLRLVVKHGKEISDTLTENQESQECLEKSFVSILKS